MSDLLTSSSQEARDLTAFASAFKDHHLVVDAEQYPLVAQIAKLAEATADLVFALGRCAKQEEDLREAYAKVWALSVVSSLHFVHNRMFLGVGDPAAEAVSTAANALLQALSTSPAYPYTRGEVCGVDALKLPSDAARTISTRCAEIEHLLTCDEMKNAYAAWAPKADDGSTSSAGAVVTAAHEMRFVHWIFADAIEALAAAQPDNHAVQKARDLAGLSIDQLRRDVDPGSAKSVLELALPAWERMSKKAAANLGGTGTSVLGPDGLLVRLVVLYAHFRLPKLLVNEPHGDFTKRVVTLLANALAADPTELHEKFRKASPRAQLESHATEAEVRAANESLLAEVQKGVFKTVTGHVEDEHVADGALVNAVVGVFAAAQVLDALDAIGESSGLMKVKALSDFGAAVAQGGAAGLGLLSRAIEAPGGGAVLARLSLKLIGPTTLSCAVIQDAIALARARAGVAGALFTAVSGAIQFDDAREGKGSKTDGVVGLASSTSGALMLVHGGSSIARGIVADQLARGIVADEAASFAFGFVLRGAWAAAIPVVGQVLGAVAFGIAAVQLADDLMTPTTERYVTAVIEALKNTRWDYDTTNKQPLAKVLGIESAVETLDAAVKAGHHHFRTIPPVPGVPRATLLQTLKYFAGYEAAEAMIYTENAGAYSATGL